MLSAHWLQPFEGEFRRVHAYHHQSAIPIFLGPGADMRKRPQAVNAGIGPEIPGRPCPQVFGARLCVQPLPHLEQGIQRDGSAEDGAGFRPRVPSPTRGVAQAGDEILFKPVGAG
jgi:hypothetical protein